MARTKALALDLLSAICLIGGGHPRVLKAFDYFRRTIGENACFETVMNDFRVHEDLPMEQYNLEYSVSVDPVWLIGLVLSPFSLFSFFPQGGMYSVHQHRRSLS